MFRIYKEPEPHYNSNMFFDLNGDDFIVTDKEVDIHIKGHDDTFNHSIKSKIKMLVEIFHNYNNQNFSFLEKDLNCYYLTNAVDLTINDSRIIFTDFLFNRTKAYYLKEGYRYKQSLWYYAGDDCYTLPPLDFERDRKIYLALNDTYRDYFHSRPQIFCYLMKHREKGFLGNPSLNMHLVSEGNPFNSSRYQPVSNSYYQQSYISIYGETVEHGTSIVVTEKTFEPLIKGHFILPFSTHGFVEHLKNIGFEFPNFINYEYDKVKNFFDRYKKFHEEMERLVNLSNDFWKEMYYTHQNIIKHNRDYFFLKPFHKVNLKQLIPV